MHPNVQRITRSKILNEFMHIKKTLEDTACVFFVGTSNSMDQLWAIELPN
jgi:hypothetical protein